MMSETANRSETILLVVNKHEDTVSFVNPETLECIAAVGTGHDPHEVIITPDQRFAYLSNYAPPGDTISVIDLPRREHVLQIPTGRFTRIHGAAIAPNGNHAYFTAGQTGYVVEIDLRTNTVTRGILTHGEVSHMVLVSPDGERLCTANIGSRDVSVIERKSGDLITRVPCDAGCEGLAFTPDGEFLWAANQEAGNITVIDAGRNEVAGTMACPGTPLRIRFAANGELALVSNWVAQGEVVAINVAERREVKRLAVGNQPIGVEISPDGRRAFVTNMSSDEIHVIDMGDLTVASVFHTGKGPDAMAWWHPRS
jgi:YVTN family beta-propeller protein